MLHAFHLSETHAFVLRYQGKPLPATNLTAVSVSHRHIIISFLTGLDGGFRQTITCQYRTGSDDFRDAGSAQYSLNDHGRDELELLSLESDTTYSIHLVSDSECPDGTPPTSDVITVTTRGKHMTSEWSNCSKVEEPMCHILAG